MIIINNFIKDEEGVFYNIDSIDEVQVKNRYDHRKFGILAANKYTCFWISSGYETEEEAEKSLISFLTHRERK